MNNNYRCGIHNQQSMREKERNSSSSDSEFSDGFDRRLDEGFNELVKEKKKKKKSEYTQLKSSVEPMKNRESMTEVIKAENVSCNDLLSGELENLSGELHSSVNLDDSSCNRESVVEPGNVLSIPNDSLLSEEPKEMEKNTKCEDAQLKSAVEPMKNRESMTEVIEAENVSCNDLLSEELENLSGERHSSVNLDDSSCNRESVVEPGNVLSIPNDSLLSEEPKEMEKNTKCEDAQLKSADEPMNLLSEELRNLSGARHFSVSLDNSNCNRESVVEPGNVLSISNDSKELESSNFSANDSSIRDRSTEFSHSLSDSSWTDCDSSDTYGNVDL